MREQKLFIGWEWTATPTVDEVLDRWTGEVVGSVCRASADDATRAVDAAEVALRRGFPVPERANVLNRTAQFSADRAEEFAQSIRAETGKPISAARTEVGRAIGTLRFAAEEALA